MLAGAWVRDYPVDQTIIARLCGMSNEAVEAELAPFAAALDGPMRRSGEVWKLTSLRDSWFLLADQLTDAQLDMLIAIFLEVLGETNPDYDDPDRRWKFDRSSPKQASANLRRGLSEAVIALGVWPEQVKGVADASHRSAAAVRVLLEFADERRWWSLSNDFRRLAEAAPDAFLSAIESALAADPSPMASLFRSDEGFMHASEYLADLMWALEILCWSPDHVGRATLTPCKARQCRSWWQDQQSPQRDACTNFPSLATADIRIANRAHPVARSDSAPAAKSGLGSPSRYRANRPRRNASHVEAAVARLLHR